MESGMTQEKPDSNASFASPLWPVQETREEIKPGYLGFEVPIMKIVGWLKFIEIVQGKLGKGCYLKDSPIYGHSEWHIRSIWSDIGEIQCN